MKASYSNTDFSGQSIKVKGETMSVADFIALGGRELPDVRNGRAGLLGQGKSYGESRMHRVLRMPELPQEVHMGRDRAGEGIWQESAHGNPVREEELERMGEEDTEKDEEMSRKAKITDAETEGQAKADAIDSYSTLMAIIDIHIIRSALRAGLPPMEEIWEFVGSLEPVVQRVKRKIEAWRNLDAETKKEGK